jgi:hypothetical protein
MIGRFCGMFYDLIPILFPFCGNAWFEISIEIIVLSYMLLYMRINQNLLLNIKSNISTCSSDGFFFHVVYEFLIGLLI